jgi:cell division septation protein DedD
MILGKYIKQLLDERKRIILPGFGNLEVKETGSGVPASGKIIDPPGLMVRFDAGYSKDDGMLASVFASGEKLDEDEAKQRVLELVDAIKYALDKGEPYTLPDAGTFTRDDDGKVHFKSDPNWVVEPDQYGLESMELLELEELPEEEEEVPEITDTPKPAPDKIVDVEPKPSQPTEPVKTRVIPQPKPRPVVKQDRHINKWKVIWMVAGGLIIVLIGLILIPSDKKRNPEQITPTVTEKPLVPSEDPTTVDTQIEDSPTSEDNESEVVPETNESQPAVEKPKFFVIAGSFKHLRNASDLQDQLKARGYPAEVMITENRMYRVSVATFASKGEAETGLAGLKSVSGLESCWLLSN